MINVRVILDRVRKIEQFMEDSERAHAAEDLLYQDVLQAIAAGDVEYPHLVAEAALKTQDLNFSRWWA